MNLPIKTGVELELWVVDDAGRLCDGRDLANEHERIVPEFVGCLLEVQTEPHDSLSELRTDLHSTLRSAIRAADAEDKRLVPLGTPLTSSDGTPTGTRGRITEMVYGDEITCAKNCAGTHLHFERENPLEQLTVLTALDPALALLSSSPYYCGERGVDSARALAYRTKCGEELRPCCELWDYADSLETWTDRVDSAYERFRSVALDRGVSMEAFEQEFSPEDTVLNPVRLRESQPTVEWRAPDAALPSDIVRLAADVGRVVAQTDAKPLEYGDAGIRADAVGIPEMSRVRKLSRQAIRSGIGAVPVRNYLRDMGFDLSRYRPLSPQLRGPPELDESEARRLRLEQARRLRADVAVSADDSAREHRTAPFA